MNIIYTETQDDMTVKLTGEIDHHGAKSAREEIDKVIFKKSPRILILDMSSVTFCDSSGLGLIMGRYKAMKESGGELLLKKPAAPVEKIVKLAGLEKLIKIID